MLESIQRMLNAIVETAKGLINRLPRSFNSLIPDLEFALMGALVEEAIRAMDRIPEYSAPEAEPLRQNLIRNLSAVGGDGRPVHVRITKDGKTRIFDEDFAGTASDFEQARHPSKNPQGLRYRFWRYGIYARDVEGEYEPSDQTWFNKAVDNLPSYSEIIDERLSIWGEKAPYWYFIEYGTTGGGRAYPSFPGTFFITNFTIKAQEAVMKMFDDAVREYKDAAIKAINDAAREGQTKILASDGEMLGRVKRRNGNPIWQRRDARGRFGSGPTFRE